jgi:hypothetical protein
MAQTTNFGSHNGFGLDIFPENTKAGKRLSKGQYLLLIVQ